MREEPSADRVVDRLGCTWERREDGWWCLDPTANQSRPWPWSDLLNWMPEGSDA